jgi:hypothetical protein
VDSVALVEKHIDDGRRFIELLGLKEIDVTAAAWVKTSEEGIWFLYLATEEVDKKGLSSAYREIYGVLRAEMPDASFSTSEVKLIGKAHPITRDILATRGDRVPNAPIRFGGSMLGGLGIEEAYIYTSYVPLRHSFTVSYTRKGDTNQWDALTKQGELYRDVRAKGAVGYTTASWEGEKEGSEKHARVLVLLEIGPQFDDARLLSNPGVLRAMKWQAEIIADETFNSHHPGAVIEHIDDEARHHAKLRTVAEAATQMRGNAPFVGGPYDGMRITTEQINKFGHLTPVSTKRGIRLFVLLPPPEDWERLQKGEITIQNRVGILHPYERKFASGGAEFHFSTGQTLSEALADG